MVKVPRTVDEVGSVLDSGAGKAVEYLAAAIPESRHRQSAAIISLPIGDVLLNHLRNWDGSAARDQQCASTLPDRSTSNRREAVHSPAGHKLCHSRG